MSSRNDENQPPGLRPPKPFGSLQSGQPERLSPSPPKSPVRQSLTGHYLRRVDPVANGDAIATTGTPVYDEYPLDLTIGLHFSTENDVIEYDGAHEYVHTFAQMKDEFMSTAAIEVSLALSVCHTQVDLVMNIGQENPRFYVAARLVDPYDWVRIHNNLRGTINKWFAGIQVPIRYYLNYDEDMKPKGKGKGKAANPSSSGPSSRPPAPNPPSSGPSSRSQGLNPSFSGPSSGLQAPATPTSGPSTTQQDVTPPQRCDPASIHWTPSVLKRRYAPGDVPIAYSDRSKELPQKCPMRVISTDVIKSTAEDSLVGAAISLKEGSTMGTGAIFVACRDTVSGRWITDKGDGTGTRVPFMLTNHHVARPSNEDILSIADAENLPDHERIITRLSRGDRELTRFALVGRIRDSVENLQDLVERNLEDPESPEFKNLPLETRKNVMNDLWIGHHRYVQLRQDLALFDQLSPDETAIGSLFLSSGRRLETYPHKIGGAFRGNNSHANPVAMDYALIRMFPEFWPRCVNVIPEYAPFPVTNYPVDFDTFKSHRSITEFALPSPYTTVAKIPSRTNGMTFGQIMPDRRVHSRSNVDSFEINVVPINQNIFSDHGDSGAAVLDGGGRVLGLVTGGKNELPAKNNTTTTNKPPKGKASQAPSAPSMASITPSSPFPVVKNQPFARNFRNINIISIEVIREDLGVKFGIEMELYSSQYGKPPLPAAPRLVLGQPPAAIPQRRSVDGFDVYGWYRLAKAEGVITADEKQRFEAETRRQQDELSGLPSPKSHKTGP